jgi:hypothetical protein
MTARFALVLLAVASTMSFYSPNAIAGAETDRKVGKCVNYLILLGRSNAAQLALNQADNVDRALQFARTELMQINRWKDEGKWNATMERGYAVGAESACREIGIRPGDYTN